MNLEEESLLSAYLDDELDAARRSEVEAALRSNPRLNQTLRDLSATRDLVAALRRPAAPADLSAEILSRLAPRRQTGPRRLVAAARRLPGPFLLGAGVSLAAGVVLAVTLTLPGLNRPAPIRPGQVEDGLAQNVPPKNLPTDGRSRHRDALQSDQGPEKPGGVAVEPSRTGGREVAPPASPALVAGQAPEIHRRVADPVALADATPRMKDSEDLKKSGEKAVEAVAEREVGEDAARVELLAMLERPGVRRLMLVADVIDEQLIEDFDDVVTNARLKYPLQGRVEIGQGVILDPDEPEGRAVIFAMSMDDAERIGLRESLKEKFPKAVVRDEATSPPDVPTHLAGEVGKFKVFRGEAAAGLMANHLKPQDQTFALKMAHNHGMDGLGAEGVRAAKPAEALTLEQKREGQDKADHDVAQEPATPAVSASKEGRPDLFEAKRQSVGLRAEARKRNGQILNEPASKAEGPSQPRDDGGVVGQARGKDADNGRRAPEPETVLVWLTDRRKPR